MLVPFFNAIVWIVLTYFIGMEYLTYGYSALINPYLHHEHIRVQDLVFPTKMNCKLSHIGYSGTYVWEDSICNFPAGYVYQWAFVGIWYVGTRCCGN